MEHRGIKPYKGCINDDPGLTLSKFKMRDKFCLPCIYMEKIDGKLLNRKNLQQMNRLIEDYYKKCDQMGLSAPVLTLHTRR